MAKRKGPISAAAIQYKEQSQAAPVLLAAGQGKIAEKIIDTAREAKIPVVEDAALVTALLALELGDEIPPELYQAVARVLVFVYDVEKRRQLELDSKGRN